MHQRTGRYRFKRLDSEQEQTEVNRLLYETFVQEIPRYEDPGTESLVDRFHERNVYFVALHRDRVCGVLAVHDGPDYSVTGALDSPHKLDEIRGSKLEARIFAVAPSHRFGIVFGGLSNLTFQFARQGGFAAILITGLAAKQRMYARMGFQPLGPPVPRGNAYFVPMVLQMDKVPSEVNRDLQRWQDRTV